MAHRRLDQVPPHFVQGFDAHQKEMFLKVYNHAYHTYGDERRALSEAQGAVRRVTGKTLVK